MTDLKRLYPLALGCAFLAVLAYLFWGLQTTPGGFPVDDAWIHQVFARNLATRGEFSYNPGQPVAGSTAPLWTLLLVPGYIFGGEGYRWWAYGLGFVFLGLAGVEVFRLYKLVVKDEKPATPALVACLFTIFEWRLVWAGASGMETTLFTFLVVLVMRLYLSAVNHQTASTRRAIFDFALAGLAGGLLALTRPEGIALVGLAGLDTGRKMLVEKKGLNWLLPRWVALGGACLLLLIPYGVFNLIVSGSVLPTTFQAKANYYVQDNPITGALNYLGAAFATVLLRGPLLALIPGLLFLVWQALRGKTAVNWFPAVWMAIILLLYAWKLPVTYHNGRYLMPQIPLLVLYGVYGSYLMLQAIRAARFPVIARVLPLLAALLWFYSFGVGAETYALQVEYINTQQVTVGKWLRDNTPPGTIVASHDIGAIGYFSDRKLVDSGGLISPAYIPFVRDEAAILKQLRADGVNYLALLPDWYPALYEQLTRENRTVYQQSSDEQMLYGKENTFFIFKI